MLGDNIFFKVAGEAARRCPHGRGDDFGYQVMDPERFGVVEFDDNFSAPLSLEEAEAKAEVELGGHRSLFLRWQGDGVCQTGQTIREREAG